MKLNKCFENQEWNKYKKIYVSKSFDCYIENPNISLLISDIWLNLTDYNCCIFYNCWKSYSFLFNIERGDNYNETE